MKEHEPASPVKPRISRRRWMVAAVSWSIIGLISWAVFAFIRHNRQTAELSDACQNAATISRALSEFDSKYGRFPDSSTAAKVAAQTHTELILGAGSSNQFFRQLLVTTLPNEKPFFVSVRGGGYPDGVMTEARALQAGECGFTYLPGLSRAASDSGTPVLFAPMIPGTYTFERGPFGSKAVIAFADGHLEILPLDSKGRAMMNGMDLFDLRQSFWHGRMPDLKWHEERLKSR